MTPYWPQVPFRGVACRTKSPDRRFRRYGLPLLGVSNQDGLHQTEKPRISDMSRYLRVDHRWFAYNPMRINVGSIGWPRSGPNWGYQPGLCGFLCTDRIEPKLLYLFLRRLRVCKRLTSKRQVLSEKDVYRFISTNRFSLPPLSEQRRIVARIEELTAKINEARTLRRQAAEEAQAFSAS